LTDPNELKTGHFYWIRSELQSMSAFGGSWIVARWDGENWTVPGSDEGWSAFVWRIVVGAHVTRDAAAASAANEALSERRGDGEASVKAMAHEDGYYWIRHEVPVIDGLGIEREEWSAPRLARLSGLDWRPLAEGGVIADQFRVEVLGERLVEPVVRSPMRVKAERIVALVENTVAAVAMEGDNAELDFDREQLVDRIEKVLRGES